MLNPFCCDPFRYHGDLKSKGKVIITKEKANDLLCFDLSIIPGCKVCSRCYSELSGILNGKSQIEDISLLSSHLNTLSIENEVNSEIRSCEMKLNQEKMMNVIDGLPESFEISPIRTHGLHAEDIHKQIQYKLESLGEKIEIQHSLNEELANFMTIEGLWIIQKVEQYDLLMDLIRKKIAVSDTEKKIQLLTLGPQTCSRNTLVEYFGVSDYLVRESRQVFKTTGILGDVAHKNGKKLPIETIRVVESFYQNDEYTRQMPGKKDYISIGRNIHIQKRLILCNLKELFTEFKSKFPNVKVRILNIICNKSFCFISDDTEHDVAMVHYIIQIFTEHLKSIIPNIRKIQYFSDGCAGQYRNRKHLYNLCQHLNDFGIDAVWNFFATSHGKSPCDGIGGTVKRVTTRASLQRPKEGQILSPIQMFQFCSTTTSLSSINFFSFPKFNYPICGNHLMKKV